MNSMARDVGVCYMWFGVLIGLHRSCGGRRLGQAVNGVHGGNDWNDIR